MNIALLSTPWAADAAHIVTAETEQDWIAAVAAIPPGRFAAAVWMDVESKPHPVQRFSGAEWPQEVVSEDGFLVVRTGLAGAKLAPMQWQCLQSFPDHLRQYDDFLGDVGSDFARRAIYPPLRPVDDDID